MTKAVAVKENQKKKNNIPKVNMKQEKTPNKGKLKNAIAKTPETMVQKTSPKGLKKQLNAENQEKSKGNAQPNNQEKQNVGGKPAKQAKKEAGNKKAKKGKMNTKNEEEFYFSILFLLKGSKDKSFKVQLKEV
ncbi:hypothetical protein RUM44_004992 [Polyplax serrata]|uniref:Uncharacterized protein n=1 Tax=Polyplax serrata TaxID=468196 RepID=A0ABR1AWQ8_POLSC